MMGWLVLWSSSRTQLGSQEERNVPVSAGIRGSFCAWKFEILGLGGNQDEPGIGVGFPRKACVKWISVDFILLQNRSKGRARSGGMIKKVLLSK